MNNSQMTIKRLFCLAIAVLFLFLVPLIFNNPYWMHLIIMSFINMVLGMTFSLLFSLGLINLGGAAFYGIGAYVSTLLTMKLGLSFWLALPLATGISGMIALGLGLIIVRHPGVAFVVITMVFSMVVVQVPGQMALLGGWGGISAIPSPNAIGPIEFAGKTPYYYLMLILLLLIALVFHAFYSSRFGRIWHAIKVSPALAETLGIHLYRYRVMAFIISSSAAGAVGSFYAHYIQTLTPDAFGGWVSIYIQLYAVLGGLNFYIVGPAIGGIIMTFVPEFLRITKEVEPIITGALLLLIVLFFPSGILGTLRDLPRLGLSKVPARAKEIKDWVFALKDAD